MKGLILDRTKDIPAMAFDNNAEYVYADVIR